MSTDVNSPYIETFLSQSTLQRLEAGAYEQLCEHLRERSDEVQNIDLMTLSGFCRNCLAKWLVVEARKHSEELKKSGSGDPTQIQALDALGYDEAAEYVYGMAYGDWKKRHAKKASDEKMEKFNASKDLWAKHDKQLLEEKAEKPSTPVTSSSATDNPLLSNVCCQDPELASKPAMPPKTTRVVTPKVPAPPTNLTNFTLGILTVSDRASEGKYGTGDLSGPAVEKALKNYGYHEITHKEIVPDDKEAIQSKLKAWSVAKIDMILTTGGTGFAPRDVTPEATKAVLDHECTGLMAYVANECAKQQPLSALSRGTAGVCGSTLIINLPGNPKGVEEIVPVLMPLAMHAVADLQKK